MAIKALSNLLAKKRMQQKSVLRDNDASALITVTQNSFSDKKVRPQNFNQYTLPARIKCQNPNCGGGGLDMHFVLSHFGLGKHQFYCLGHLLEDNPLNKYSQNLCLNSFKIEITRDKLGSINQPD